MKPAFPASRLLAALAAAATFGLLAPTASAAPAVAKSAPAAPVSAAPASAANAIQRSLVQVQLPELKLLRQDGKSLGLRQALDDGRPVLLNFTYTSCSSICPVSAQVFAQVREQLGADRERVHLVSVSIDAAFDTVPRLAEYVAKLGSGNSWSFFTGHEVDSLAVQKAFGAYRGDKMNHVPLTYLRGAPGQPWIRLEGLVGPDQLLGEVRRLLPPAAAATSSATSATSAGPAGRPPSGG
jgi:protein SCO1/2